MFSVASVLAALSICCCTAPKPLLAVSAACAAGPMVIAAKPAAVGISFANLMGTP
jgi:hypothetical protein